MTTTHNGVPPVPAVDEPTDDAVAAGLAQALRAVRLGRFDTRLPRGLSREVVEEFDALVGLLERRNRDLLRIGRVVGREGRMLERLNEEAYDGAWAEGVHAVNALIDDLGQSAAETARVIEAVAQGDLSQHMALEIAGRPLRGEFLRIGRTVNTMVDQLSSFADEVTRVAREVGIDGRLGGQAAVRGVSGTWRDLTDSVNTMASNLTDQVRSISSAATAIAQGDLSRKITVSARGEVAELAETINALTDTLRRFADEVTRVAREVGTDGRLGGQAAVPNVAGTWKDLTDAVNLMAANLTAQVRGIAQVATAVATGDLSQKITVDARGEILELKDTVNTMVDQLSSFADEVTRVAREVGTEGNLGGQAQVRGVAGTWRDLTDNVNSMASNLTGQVRNIAQVTTAVARGDLSQKITVDARGEILELKDTVNTMVDQLSSFADEVTRVAREVGTEGNLGGQAEVRGVAGTWRDLTENVNQLAGNLTDQVRNIAQVTTAVARGDLSQKITVDARGEILELKNTVNTMVDQLSSFADEVTRVAREVGTEGNLGGQAEVRGVAGTWRDLTENVNQLAGNLTDQVRNIAQVTTAVARGDLSQKITVDARGEILELKNTVNTMVDQLRSFADEVTRVAREVGTEGTLGGQAEVRGVAGTWRDLTENVNQLASTLTTQLRAISAVSTAVASGDLSPQITVAARGEIADLKDTINQMIAALAHHDRGQRAAGLARLEPGPYRRLLQGQRDLGEVCSMIMNEVAPLVDAQVGAFFLADAAGGRPDGSRPRARAAAGDVRRLRRRPGVRGRRAAGVPARRGPRRAGRRGRAPGAGGRRPARLPADPLGGRRDPAAGGGRAPGPVRGPHARRHRVRGGDPVQRAAPDLPRAPRRHHRRRDPHDPGQPAHRGAARAVAGPGGGAADPLRAAAAHQRRAGGEGRAALGAEPQHRDQEHGDRRGPARRRGEGPAARRRQPVQVGVPGQHEPRAAHAAQLAAAAVAVAGRQPGREPEPPPDRVRQHDPQRGLGPAAAHRRHPRPVQDRGGARGRRARVGRPRGAARFRRARVRAAGRAQGPRAADRGRPGAARRDRHRRAAAAADPAQPAVERHEVHRARQRRARHGTRPARSGRPGRPTVGPWSPSPCATRVSASPRTSWR